MEQKLKTAAKHMADLIVLNNARAVILLSQPLSHYRPLLRKELKKASWW